MSRLPLYRLAHARAGDKGNDCCVTLIPYDRNHLELIARQLTPARLKAAYPQLLRGPVQIRCLPRLGVLHILMRDALEGGVNGSLGLDGHGKSWSYLVLRLEIEVDEP